MLNTYDVYAYYNDESRLPMAIGLREESDVDALIYAVSDFFDVYSADDIYEKICESQYKVFIHDVFFASFTTNPETSKGLSGAWLETIHDFIDCGKLPCQVPFVEIKDDELFSMIDC